MLRLHIVLQGGGANVVTLMAAAKALEKLEADKKVKVISVTGVSAGAIAACMLASPHKMDIHRKLTMASGEAIIKKFNIEVPEERTKIWMPFASKKMGVDQDIFKFLEYLAKGNTLLSEDDMRGFFDTVFAIDSDFSTLGHLKKPTLITATDLRTQSRVHHSCLLYTSDAADE